MSPIAINSEITDGALENPQLRQQIAVQLAGVITASFHHRLPSDGFGTNTGSINLYGVLIPAIEAKLNSATRGKYLAAVKAAYLTAARSNDLSAAADYHGAAKESFSTLFDRPPL